MDSWMKTANDEFRDIHEKLRSYNEVLKFLQVVEKEIGILSYCNGANSSARWIFQIFNKEFIDSISKLLEKETGLILEVMAGDGKLTEFLQPRIDTEIVATDTRRDSHDIAYPKWVIESDAFQAVRDINPSIVILCWEPLYSDVSLNIVDEDIPLIWIGDPRKCAPNSGLLDRKHIKYNSSFALGRYDSVIDQSFNTDIYLFNFERNN